MMALCFYINKMSKTQLVKQKKTTSGIQHRNRTLPGGRLNKKDGLTRYGDSHVKDKTS